MATITSHKLNRYPGRARRAAKDGPVVITNRGRPTHVIVTIDDYHRLVADGHDGGDDQPAAKAERVDPGS